MEIKDIIKFLRSSEGMIIMLIVLILLLTSICIALEYKGKDFKRDCKETFDINGTCPCKPTKDNSNAFNLKIYNNSEYNINVTE